MWNSPNTIVFIHLPKTAGSSFIQYLTDLYDHSDIYGPTTERLISRGQLTHKQNSLFCGHFFASYFIEAGFTTENSMFVTFLRHPLSRIESWYNHYCREQRYKNCIGLSPLLGETNSMTLMLSPLPLHSAKYSISDHLNAAKEFIDKFYFVGIQEDFENDKDIFLKKLGFPAQDKKDKLRVSNAEVLINSNLKEEIIQRNWADFELYNYVKQNREINSRLRSTSPPISDNRRFSNNPENMTLSKSTLTPIKWDAGKRLIGHNFYAREGLGGPHPQPWRWTGPNTTSYFYFHLETGQWLISIRVVNSMTPEILLGLRFFIDDKEIVCEQERDELWGIKYTAKFNRLSNENPLELKISVPRTVKFSDIDPSLNDDRSCGVALSEIYFLPLMD